MSFFQKSVTDFCSRGPDPDLSPSVRSDSASKSSLYPHRTNCLFFLDENISFSYLSTSELVRIIMFMLVKEAVSACCWGSKHINTKNLTKDKQRNMACSMDHHDFISISDGK